MPRPARPTSRLSLSSLLGVTALDIDNSYNGSVHTWAWGADVASPLVDFGRTESAVGFAIAKNQEQLALSTSAVLAAFREVRDALSFPKNALIFEAEQIKREKTMIEAQNVTSQ